MKDQIEKLERAISIIADATIVSAVSMPTVTAVSLISQVIGYLEGIEELAGRKVPVTPIQTGKPEPYPSRESLP